MTSLDDIKNYDDWTYYRFNYPVMLHGVVYRKCAVANEPFVDGIYCAVLMVADDLTMRVLPTFGYKFLTVGNMEEVSLNNIVFGRDS